MDPLTLGAIFGGGQLLKHFIFDKPSADRQRKLESEKERYSPWTGHQDETVQEPNLGGGMLQAGFAGAQLGSSLQTASAQKDLMNKMGDKFQSATPVLPGGQVAQPTLPSQMKSYVPQYSSPWRLSDQTLYGNS